MYEKTGYLDTQLKLFYLSDTMNWECPYHYHDFDKLTIFLQGRVTYEIEGQSYLLQPYDIIVVPAGQMHRPIISDTSVYERIIAYIAPSFFDIYKQRHCDLSGIFTQLSSHVLRQSQEAGNVYGTACRLRQAWAETDEDVSLLQETLFLELMIYLAKAIRKKNVDYVKTGSHNVKIQQIMHYINDHIAQPLSVPLLARQFYVSPDYLMHLFKGETGYSLGNYITTKRLLAARTLMEKDIPLTTVCYDSGFKNYSTFYRAWKKFYGVSPKKGISNTLSEGPIE